MAGARTALDASGAAPYYNVAGLAFAHQTRGDIGVGCFGSSLSYNGQDAGSDPFSGGTASLVVPFRGKLKGFAFGLYGFFPADDLGHVVTRDPGTPQFLQYDGLHRFALYAGVAYRLGPVAAGAGLQVLNAAQGSLALTEDLAAATIPQRTLTLDLVPQVSPDFGLAVEATSWLRLGASYRGASQVALSLPSNVNLGPLAFDLQLAALSFYRPPTWTLAGAYPTDGRSIGSEVSWREWSRAPDPALAATFTPSSPLLPNLATTPSGLQLRDEPVVRVGGQVNVAGPISVLAGYAFAPTPVPSPTGPNNILDCDRHEIAAGVEWDFADLIGFSTGPDSLVLGGQYHALVQRQAVKNDPLDLYGDGTYGGNLWMVNLTLILHFGRPL